MKSAETLFILLDLYDGAFGPTLRIDIPSRDLLENVTAVFDRVARKQDLKVDLAHLPFVRPGNVASLELVVDNEEHAQGGGKRLRLRDRASSGNQFSWYNAPEAWKGCVDLLVGFTDCPGHQYLTRERIDDALVEVAYLER